MGLRNVNCACFYWNKQEMKSIQNTTGQWFSTCTPASSTNKIECHDITEILLKVALTTITNKPNTTHLFIY